MFMKKRKLKTVRDRIEETAREKAGRFQRLFENTYQKKIEISMDAVRSLDHMLYKDAVRGILGPERLEEMGCFLAEIIRRNFNGRYERDAAKDTIVVNAKGIRTYPLIKVTRAAESLRKDGVPPDAYTPKNTGPIEGYLFNLARKTSGEA
jgi:hypothetical protein